MGRKCVKCKWVFEIKRNGIFRSRLVACGYSQVPGVDFTESYAPVINDITWRILIIIKMIFGYSAKIVDVETAFLYGDLDEEIFMDCPPGMEHEEDECLELNKSIYGLVQAARQYYLKFTQVLRKIGFIGGKADPCLFKRQDTNGTVFIAIWVDDSLLIGDDLAIEATIKDLRKAGFNLKIEGSLDDYLSCEISMNDNNTKGWIHQPHLLKKLELKFGKDVEKLQDYTTPGTPGISTLRDADLAVSKEEHKYYRSGVGMLLYLVKHTRPDIANAVRELSKALDKPSPAAIKEMKRVIKYVLTTKNQALKVAPTPMTQDEMWTMTAFSDSDYATDPETRRSITGFVLYLMGVPISWKSKGQKSVSLSSTEAEYIALSETAKEVRFVYQVLESIGFKVKLPIVIRVDNVGAIFLSENVAISQRTKHVDIRYRFVQEFILDGFLKIVFVKTEENDADIMTKNLRKDLFLTHSEKLMGDKSMDFGVDRKGVGRYRSQNESCGTKIVENGIDGETTGDSEKV